MKIPIFGIGDMVQFDSYGTAVGIVIDVKDSISFEPSEKITDILVSWSNGNIFWCLDFTLILISRYKD
jgi:hypothetical protein